MNFKATIIVLDYMKASRAVEGVRLIVAQKTDFNFKIIVVDNSCDDKNALILKDGLKEYPNIKLIINSENLGYIKAHNAIKDKIEGEYLFIINPDILLKEKYTLQKMIDYMENNPRVGVLGPKQINDSGEIAMTVRAFPHLYVQVARRTFLRKLPLLKEKVIYDEMKQLDYSKIQDVDWLQSSCMLIRKDLWNKIGGFYEGYFLFMADVELCFQVWKNGYRVVYYPKTQVYADGKRVSAGGFLSFFKNWVLRQHVKDAIKYQVRHLFKINPRKDFYKKQYDQNRISYKNK